MAVKVTEWPMNEKDLSQILDKYRKIIRKIENGHLIWQCISSVMPYSRLLHVYASFLLIYTFFQGYDAFDRKREIPTSQKPNYLTNVWTDFELCRNVRKLIRNR